MSNHRHDGLFSKERIVAPLADRLMKVFATDISVGVWQTFLALAAIYFVFMLGVARAAAYSVTMCILAALLVIGLLCNAAVRPVADSEFVTEGSGVAPGSAAAQAPQVVAHGMPVATVLAAWAVVLVPILWGVTVTLGKAVVLFR